MKRGETLKLFIRTGLKEWDARGGITRGILTVIGAATGDGKSILKLHLAQRAAEQGLLVCMLDFEDPGSKTADRTFSSYTGINSRRLGMMDNITEFELEQLERAWERIKPWASRIDHHEGLVDAKEATRLMRAKKYDLILVDYAQAFRGTEDESKTTVIGDFTWDANAYAGEEHEPAVVVFSQLKPHVEEFGRQRYERWKAFGRGDGKREEGSPDISGYCPNGLNDVAWATAMGQHAKCLLYIWRPGRIAQKLGHKKIKDNVMKLIAGKANFSAEDDITFAFDGATATISDHKKEAA